MTLADRFAPTKLGRRRAWLTRLSVTTLLPIWLLSCAQGVKAQSLAKKRQAAHADAESLGPDSNNRDDFRNAVPTTEPVAPLSLPIPETLTLDNGLRVWVYSKRDLPLVQVTALFKVGSAHDPKGLEGLANLTAETMRRGTRHRSSHAIAMEVENLGGQLDVDVIDDATLFSVSAMTENIGPIFDVLSDVLQHPTFARDAFEREQKQRITDLLQMHSEPRAAARTAFRRVVFGDHPYGNNGLGTQSSVKALHPSHAAQFCAKHITPRNGQIIVVGDVSTQEARALVFEKLASWQNEGKTDAPASAATKRPQETAVVDKPGLSQSHLILGGLGISRRDPDYFPSVVANAILGGMFNSRLNMNLREDKGWTYGVHSYFTYLRAPGPFAIALSVRSDATLDAIREIFAEIERMRSEDVSPEELLAAINHYTLSLPANFEGLGGIARMIGVQALHDLPEDYYRTLYTALGQVTPKDVRRVMQAYMGAKDIHTVVVGDAATLLKPLEALAHGPVLLRDGDGSVANMQKKPMVKAPGNKL